MWTKMKLAGAIAVAASAVILLGACAGKTDNTVSVTTANATKGRLVKTVSFSGVLAPDQTVNVFSELRGHATAVNVAVGDKVKAGQVLVKIDDRELRAQLAEAQAGMRSVEDQAAQAQVGIQTAKANLDLAQKSYDRVEALYKTQAVPKSQADDAQNKLELAKSAYENAQKQLQLLSGSGLAQAKARIELIQVQLSETTITSPISGVITNSNVNVGELVSVASPVMTVADTSTLKLQGTVSQGDIPLLAVGQKMQIQVDGIPANSYDGAITQVGPVAAATGQYFPVIVSLKNDGKLLAGMTAMASLHISGPEGVIIPSTAVQRDGSDTYVYIVNGGTVSRTKVTVDLQNSSDTSVSGIAAGDVVATSNIGTLQNGMSVVKVPSEDPSGNPARSSATN